MDLPQRLSATSGAQSAPKHVTAPKSGVVAPVDGDPIRCSDSDAHEPPLVAAFSMQGAYLQLLGLS